MHHQIRQLIASCYFSRFCLTIYGVNVNCTGGAVDSMVSCQASRSWYAYIALSSASITTAFPPVFGIIPEVI